MPGVGSPAEDLEAVLDVLKARGLAARVLVVGPVTVQFDDGPPPPLAAKPEFKPPTSEEEQAEFERVLFGSARGPS